MLGAIAGDIIGSVHEFEATKTKDFDLFTNRSAFTDDTILSVAVAESLLTGKNLVDLFHDYVERYPNPDGGYGGTFLQWAFTRSREPYNSWGNGSAMRVSPVGIAFDSLDDVLREAERTAAVTHNHPEGIKGAQATAASIYLARNGASKAEIRDYVTATFDYDLSRTVDDIRPRYAFDVSCQGSVPESIIAFLEGDDFEDTIRNAVSLGGDADTMACIAGGIAEAFWGLPAAIESAALDRLDDELRAVVTEFRARFPG